MDERRKQLFGDSSLKVYSTTPADGEVEEFEFLDGWRGYRVDPVTGQRTRGNESSQWQFEIGADEEWATTQAFMLKCVALTIGDRRWKIAKAEKPVGASLVWKVKVKEQ